uniref:7TM_GPCR_Srx domain-containing protein n=1 Tax=Steinernema glaseri TaxID=37863 RepID=A0A1I7Z4W9_9BILA
MLSGFFGYFFAVISCSLHVVMSANRAIAVATHYGYVVVGCEDKTKRLFNYGSFVHHLCWTAFCSGAIVVDGLTLLKILTIRNIPMFIDIAFLTLADGDVSDEKAFFRTTSFTLTRFTDLVNALTLLMFNPEVRRYIVKVLRQGKVTAVTDNTNSSNIKINAIPTTEN